jgi:hypothetical protein
MAFYYFEFSEFCETSQSRGTAGAQSAVRHTIPTNFLDHFLEEYIHGSQNFNCKALSLLKQKCIQKFNIMGQWEQMQGRLVALMT